MCGNGFQVDWGKSSMKATHIDALEVLVVFLLYHEDDIACLQAGLAAARLATQRDLGALCVCVCVHACPGNRFAMAAKIMETMKLEINRVAPLSYYPPQRIAQS